MYSTRLQPTASVSVQMEKVICFLVQQGSNQNSSLFSVTWMETQRLIWCDSRHSSSKHIASPSRWNWFVLLHEKAKRKQTPKECGRLPWCTLIFWNYCVSAVGKLSGWSPVGILCISGRRTCFHTCMKWCEIRNPRNPHGDFRLHPPKKNQKLTQATAGTENEWIENVHIGQIPAVLQSSCAL